jgi:hypothetical protein
MPCVQTRVPIVAASGSLSYEEVLKHRRDPINTLELSILHAVVVCGALFIKGRSHPGAAMLQRRNSNDLANRR